MKLITAAELARKSQAELNAIYRKIGEEIAATEPGSIEHTNALASLENVRRVLAARRPSGPRF